MNVTCRMICEDCSTSYVTRLISKTYASCFLFVSLFVVARVCILIYTQTHMREREARENIDDVLSLHVVYVSSYILK